MLLLLLLGLEMRRHSPGYYSPPRRGYGGRGPPSRRGYGGGRRRENSQGSLLVRNIPLDCRAEELRVPFERFGPVRDVYIPKDYYSGWASFMITMNNNALTLINPYVMFFFLCYHHCCVFQICERDCWLGGCFCLDFWIKSFFKVFNFWNCELIFEWFVRGYIMVWNWS